MASHSLDSMLMCTKPENEQQMQQDQKKPRPADEQALKCPRCDSTNTKFCYYNNYSLTQPRYFCKSCRRYWTKGGTLRNVPVGGGCRRNKRSSSLTKRTTPDYHLQVPDLITNPTSSYDHALTFAHHGNISVLGSHGNSHFDLFGNPTGNNSFLETLRGGLIDSNNHFMYYGLGGGNGNHLGDVENGRGNGVNVSYEDRRDIAMRFDEYSNNHPEIMSNPSSGSSTPTTIKQELGENRILWGFPWQLNGEGNYINGGNQESWNHNAIGGAWNNLINSPLM